MDAIAQAALRVAPSGFTGNLWHTFGPFGGSGDFSESLRSNRQLILDLQQLLQEIYRRSGYQSSIDYSQSPQPDWPNLEQRWIEEHKNNFFFQSQ